MIKNAASTQSQRVAGESIAIQSGGDTIINRGMSADDMREVIQAVAEQVPIYTAIARDMINERLKDFEEKVINKFTSDKSSNPEAFRDPDFQYLIGKSQSEYARSGDTDVEKTLINLIGERSKIEGRSRLSLTINQAVEVASVLTIEEYSALAFCFMFRMTTINGMSNIGQFEDELNKAINPYIFNISKEDMAYKYLESQGCAKISMMTSEFHQVITTNYPAFCTSGASEEILNTIGAGPALKDKSMFKPAFRNSDLYQPCAMDKTQWHIDCIRFGLNKEVEDAVWQAIHANSLSKDALINDFGSGTPNLVGAYEIWDSTPLNRLELTSVGVAIGASYVKQTGAALDLSIWIK